MERYRAAIVRYLRTLLRDASEADDLAQQTYLRAQRERDQLRDGEALAGWLYQIATRGAIDRLRQRARLAARLVRAPVDELSLVDRERPTAVAALEQAEMSRCVRGQMAKLSDVQRAVLLLHDVEGLTSEEIARLLEVPLTTVKMRLHRARRRLQQELQQACAFSRDERDVFVCDPKTEPD